jgi:hypothetical protein
LAAPRAAAHGFGQRFDLPLPLWLWVSGAGATILLTFALVALFARQRQFGGDYPRVELAPIGRGMAALLRTVAVLLFLLTLYAGFLGVQDPYRNLITTMVWIVWWVGLGFVCALVGNLWALVNPLSTLFRWAEALFSLAPRFRYPSWLGAWPAVLLFLAFAWAELVWQANDVPACLARAALAYALITWAGMLLYGREAWLQNAEAFSLAFGVLARFAPLDVSRGRLVLRPPGAGLIAERPVRFSFLAYVVLMLATVTFDGYLETPLNEQVNTALQGSRLLFELSELGLEESQLVASAQLVAFPLIFLAIFLLASRAMKVCAATRLGAVEVACAFVLTLVPIAVAYHLAHYFSLLLTAGQFIIPLASDPFGYGWDLFGTANYKVDLGVVSPYVFWYGAVSLIVIGHVIAVMLAHAAAVRVFGGGKAAIVSQIPMMVLMIAYTTLSLWILAQPVIG